MKQKIVASALALVVLLGGALPVLAAVGPTKPISPTTSCQPWQRAVINVKNESYTVQASYYKIWVGFGDWGSDLPSINYNAVQVSATVPPRATLQIIGPKSKVFDFWVAFGSNFYPSKVALGLPGLTAGPPISVWITCQ